MQGRVERKWREERKAQWTASLRGQAGPGVADATPYSREEALIPKKILNLWPGPLVDQAKTKKI